jgi:hypothetical protein
MALDLHTIGVVGGSDPLAHGDRLLVLLRKSLASPVGGSAGAAVAINIVSPNLPANAAIFVTPSQDATHWITNRTAGAFTVNIAPRLAANTLAAGTFDLLVLA